MEYRLITAVSGFPCLYDRSSPTYRDLNMRGDAWREVSQLVGVNGELLRGPGAPELRGSEAPRLQGSGAPRLDRMFHIILGKNEHFSALNLHR